jgi:hypothetical protein
VGKLRGADKLLVPRPTEGRWRLVTVVLCSAELSKAVMRLISSLILNLSDIDSKFVSSESKSMGRCNRKIGRGKHVLQR